MREGARHRAPTLAPDSPARWWIYVVKNRLQVPVDAIPGHFPPVRTGALPRNARPTVDGVQQQFRIGPDEQAAQPGCQDGCGPPQAKLCNLDYPVALERLNALQAMFPGAPRPSRATVSCRSAGRSVSGS